MNKLILWIEISDQQVRFLLRKRRLGKKSSDLLYQSVLYEQEDFLEESKPDFARLEKILKNYRKSIPGNKKIAVYLLLPFQNGLIRRFTLPWIRKRDRDSAIKYHMQYEIPFLAEELVFAYEVIDEKDGEYLNVQVSASKRDGIELYAECLAKAGFVLKGVEYSVWAMGEIFKAESFTKILCLRRYNKQTIELILYKGSVPEVIRKVRVGQADTVKYNV